MLRKIESLSLAWRVSLVGIVAIGVLLVSTAALVGWLLLGDARVTGERSMGGMADTISRMIDSTDDSARAGAERSFSMLKVMFPGRFSLEEKTGDDGKPAPVLLHDKLALNGHFAEVDRFTAATGGVATIFVRAGKDFLRISTSLKKEDGSRAMGTLLDRQGPAFAKVSEGKPYVGRATLFGKTYMTKYEPVLADGQVVGLLFIGFDMSDLLKSLAQAMQAQALFERGAVYAIDLGEGASQGQAFGLSKPLQLDLKEAQVAAVFKAMKAADRGVVETDHSLREGSAGPARNLVFVRNKAWNWAVVADAEDADLMAAAHKTVAVLAGALMLATLVLALTLVWVCRVMISRPLGGLTNALARLAQGDLSRPLIARGSDEIGRLTEAMEGFRRHLVTSLSAVRSSVDSISTASSQIAVGNADLSSRTESQASSLQQTASSIEQLTGTVKSNADAARQANQLAASASVVAERGGAVVGQVVDTMGDISASSRKIAEIIGVIDGIAFQTNILALNAAVEAARAGEQGRGFAVVAGEVRNLAQRSAQAAKEIKGLIEDSAGKVESGATQVQEAGRTMDEIVNQVKRVTDLIGEITSSTLEQSAGITQVNQAVASLDQMTQQNAALVEESAAAAESLKEQAGRLTEAVSVFKLGAAPAQVVAARVQVSSRKPAVARVEPVVAAARPVPAKAAAGEWEEF